LAKSDKHVRLLSTIQIEHINNTLTGHTAQASSTERSADAAAESER